MAGGINYRNPIPGDSHCRWKYNGVDQDSTITWPAFYLAKEYRPNTTKVKRTSSGWRSPTSFNHTFQTYRNPEVDAQAKNGSITYHLTGGCSLLTESAVGIQANLIDLTKQQSVAINQALLKLSNQQTDFGENFAEREQADRMIASRLDRYTSQLTGRYISRYRKDWRTVKKVSALVRHGMKYPESWLEFQYGAKPLVQDIYGAYNVMKDVDSDKKPARASVKGFSKMDPVIATSSPSFSNVLQPFNFQITWERTGFAFVRLDYELQNDLLVALQQIGLVNPALLAWNLLPYSFVLDWALPIGNYLQSWTATAGWRFIGGSITTVKRVRTLGLSSTPRAQPGYTYISREVMGECSARTLDFTRVALTSSPAPRLPSFKNPVSLQHTANALSLLAVALKS